MQHRDLAAYLLAQFNNFADFALSDDRENFEDFLDSKVKETNRVALEILGRDQAALYENGTPVVGKFSHAGKRLEWIRLPHESTLPTIEMLDDAEGVIK